MKKYVICLVLIFLSVLTGCQSPDAGDAIKIMVPNGTTSIALAQLEYSELDRDDPFASITRVSGPDRLIAAFTSGSHDVIVAPLNLGANLYNKGIDYQLGGVLTWGNLQLISSTPLTTLVDLEGKTIVGFGAGAIPELILQRLLDHASFDTPPTVDYSAGSAQESMMAFLQDPSVVALVAEPVLSIAKETAEDVYTLDLGHLWEVELGLPLFPQAGVFIRGDVEKETMDAIIALIEDSIAFAYASSNELAEMTLAMNYPFEMSIVSAVILNSGIDYIHAKDAKPAIGEFFNLILDSNPDLIHRKLPDDGFYSQ